MKKYLKIILGSLIFAAWIALADYTYMSWLPSGDLSLFGKSWSGWLVTKSLLAIALLQGVISVTGVRRFSFFRVLANASLHYMAMLLYVVMLPLCYIWAWIKLIQCFGLSHGTELYADWLLDNAHAVDQSGNTLGSFLFSDLFIKVGYSKQYGNSDETISHVTAVVDHALVTTWMGEFLALVINTLDRNHTGKALVANQWNENLKEKIYKRNY